MKKIQSIKQYALALIEEGKDKEEVASELYSVFGHLMMGYSNELYGIKTTDDGIAISYWNMNSKLKVSVSLDVKGNITEESSYD